MLFLALLVFLGAAYSLPWWSVVLASLVLTRLGAAPIVQAGAAGVAWFVMAVLSDAAASGQISVRVAGLFSLPSVYLAYLLMAGLGAATVFLCAKVFKGLSVGPTAG